MVMGGDSYSKGGSNPGTVNWMDIFQINLLLSVKKTKKKKRPGVVHLKLLFLNEK